MSEPPGELVVFDGEDEILRLAVADQGNHRLERSCPCGAGRVMLCWLLDPDNPGQGMPMFLHTVPTCAAFDRAPFRDYWTFTRTGTIPEHAPIVPSEPKPEKPRKATHR
jgi:hypothetical protein